MFRAKTLPKTSGSEYSPPTSTETSILVFLSGSEKTSTLSTFEWTICIFLVLKASFSEYPPPPAVILFTLF